MPIDAQLTFFSSRLTLALFEDFDAFIDADELMILSDDLSGLVVVHDEVFNVVEQARGREQAREGEFDADALS